MNVDLRLTPKVSTFSGTGVISTVKGEGVVAIGPGDNGTRTISFKVPKDGDTDDTEIVLRALWGTRSDLREISDSRTIRDTDAPAPGALAAPTVTATAGNGHVTLTWTAVTGATRYQYAYAATGSTMGAWMPAAGQTATTVTIPNLTNGTNYTFSVRAGDASGYSASVGTGTATPTAGTPPPTGDIVAGEYTLTASASMTEGQSLVPVSVRYTVRAAASGTRSATVTITVSVLQRATSDGLTVARETIYESEDPPVTRAELSGATAGVVNEVVALGTTTDVQWLTDESGDDGDIVYTNAVAGQAFFVFDYGEGAFDETHTAYLRTNRDTDAEDELFKLVATDTEAGVKPSTGADKKLVRIDDVQTQDYELDFPINNPPHEIDEGEDAGLELAPVPPRTVDMPFNVTLSAEDVTDYSLDDIPAAISQNYTSVPGTLAGRAPFTVNTSTNDGDREDDTVTVTARTTELTGTQRVLETLDIKVLDLHLLPSITLTKVEIPDAENKLQEAAKTADGNYIIPEARWGRSR